MTVVALPRPSNEDVARMFDELAARARAGEIISAVVACEVSDRSTGSTYELGETGNVAYLVTALERAKLRLLER